MKTANQLGPHPLWAATWPWLLGISACPWGSADPTNATIDRTPDSVHYWVMVTMWRLAVRTPGQNTWTSEKPKGKGPCKSAPAPVETTRAYRAVPPAAPGPRA